MTFPPLAANGVLPPGRFVCTPSDVEASFVAGLDPVSNCQELWMGVS